MTTKVLGLDIGINSIGFALLSLDKDNNTGDILCHGVHLFDRAEGDKGESLALPYRTNRSARRVTRRRAGRLTAIRKLFDMQGLGFYGPNLNQDFKSSMGMMSQEASPWELRTKGLTELLSVRNFCRILYHIAKHRGFQSNKKGEVNTNNLKEKDLDDNGKMLKHANTLKAKMQETDTLTPGAYFYLKGIRQGLKVRNSGGDYSHTILRQLQREEVALLFERQRSLGAEWATPELEHAYVEYAFSQRPLQSVRDMVGLCSLEKHIKEKRTAKHSRSGELFVLWTKINHLRLIDSEGNSRTLDETERQILFQLAHQNKDTTYASIRKTLKVPVHERFNSLRYQTKSKPKQGKKAGDIPSSVGEEGGLSWEETIKSTEQDAKWISLLGFYRLKHILSTPNSAIEQDRWDTVSEILAFEQSREAIRSELERQQNELELTGRQIDDLVAISDFKGTVGHSVKAIRRLLPYLETGATYDKAVLKAYGAPILQQGEQLPPFPETTNPIVNRAFAQTRKVVNAVIRKHGMPDRIHVELARDISKNYDERKKIEKEQLENKLQNDKSRLAIQTEFPGVDPLVYRLWMEQGHRCLYSKDSDSYISPDMLSDSTAVEIDHILPRSRSFDNSYMNKVLVMTRENRNKQNRTTWEYFQEKSVEERDALIIRAARLPKAKRDRLFNQTFNEREQDWKERHLNDTRWITRQVLNHIQSHLALPGEPNQKRVMALNGRITADLRRAWGFARKNRSNPRHHALDAMVVAACTEGNVQRVTAFNKAEARVRGLDPYAPKPWPSFREDALRRIEDPNWIISRLANRKVTAEINGPNPVRTRRDEKNMERRVERLALTSMKRAKLANLLDKDGRNRWLYDALSAALTAAKDDPQKAFKPPYAVTTPNGKKMHINKIYTWGDRVMSGRRMRGGVVDNGSQIRVDVFKKKEKFYLVPVFAWHFRIGQPPMAYCKQGTPQEAWPTVDETFEYQFSLFRNDYVRVVKPNGEMVTGYYKGTDIATGQIKIQAHDAPDSSNYPHPGVFSLKVFEKLQVDYFGNLTQVKETERPPVRWRKKSRVAHRHGSEASPSIIVSAATPL